MNSIWDWHLKARTKKILGFGVHLEKVRQNSNFQKKTLQDRKLGPQMGYEIFHGQKLIAF